MCIRDRDKLAARKFAVLQEVREIENHEGVVATLSIGIGRDGDTLEESAKYAGLAIDMALSRGGDQAVVKNRYTFEFYGGLSEEVEKRTKVKSRVVANALTQLIRDSSQVLVMEMCIRDRCRSPHRASRRSPIRNLRRKTRRRIS